MAFITPDRINTVQIAGNTLQIKERIIPDSARSNKYQTEYCREGDPVKACVMLGENGKAKGICIHNTGNISVPAGTTPAEQYSRAMWPNCNLKGVAVHFFIYQNDIWQNLSLCEQGWHSGDGSKRKASHIAGQTINGNLDTIAIESIGDDPISTETTARLCAYLLKTLGLSPETDIYTHNYFQPAKKCPLYILPIWDSFVNRVKELYYADKAFAPQNTASEIISSELKIGDEVDFLGGYHYSNSNNPTPSGGLRTAGKANITAINKSGKHPYHLIKIAGGGSNVYGWVDENTISVNQPASTPIPEAPEPKAEAPEPKEIKIGDEVDFLGGYHYSNSNNPTPSGGLRTAGRATVTFMNPGARHPYHLVKIAGGGSNVYGWVDASSIKA